MSYPRSPENLAKHIDALDKLSRLRALTDAESMSLEHAIRAQQAQERRTATLLPHPDVLA